MKRYIVIFLAIAIIALAMGCNNSLVKELEFKEGEVLARTNGTKNYSLVSHSDQIFKQWSESAHANPVAATIGRDGCVLCHDGEAFRQQLLQAGELQLATGQNCFACHQGFGSDLKQAGIVSIPTKENSISGAGALCMSCHNSRGNPSIDDPNWSEPHYGPQGDILTGTGGIKLNEELQYNNTFGHISLDNSCIDCHMPKLDGGLRSHSFVMEAENAELICGACHENVTSFNLKANEDYDGDGVIGGMQDEISGLMIILLRAINQSLKGGHFEALRGAFLFYDQEGNLLQDVPKELYLAAYNYTLINYDGSKGIHNPFFTAQLLQQSYKALTGKDIEGATIIH
ncbi:MAG: cytochrome c3 family protein [Bacillota bacterium]